MRELIDGIEWPVVGAILGSGVQSAVWFVALFSVLSGALHACH